MQVEIHQLNELNCSRSTSAEATSALVKSHGRGDHGGIYSQFL